MERHVLLVTIGPVQDFIASARRCRDLWFGSWLLSELSKAAARGMVERLGGDRAIGWLIFPGATGTASLQRPETSVSNRILLRVEGDNVLVHDVAEAGRQAMNECLTRLREDAFERVGQGDDARAANLHEQTAIAQVDELMEYLWVAIPEGEGDGAYADARNEAERLMASRKNTKIWGRPPWGSAGVPKSSLDGVRESVLDERLYDSSVISGKRTNPPDREVRRRWYGIHGTERLCGVGLLKRHGRVLAPDGTGEVESFLSTSHMAALPFMVGVERDAERLSEVHRAWTRLIDALGPKLVREEFHVGGEPRRSFFGRVDGAVLFESRLRESLRERGRSEKEENVFLELRQRVIKAAGRGELSPYYGILVADGDRMGAVIDAQSSFEQHRELSLALDELAREARDIVTDAEGSPIYAGGDDVLALLPLHTALECVMSLARRFQEKMAPWKTKEGESATLSAGLVLVHSMMPLDEALAVARAAERIAKHDAKRNALAVTVAKRGGSPVTVFGHWEKLVPRLESLCRLRLADAIADRAGYELVALARLTDGAKDETLEGLREIQRVEALRILFRKRAERGRKELAESTLDELTPLIGQASPDALGRELYVAEQLARSLAQAGTEASS